MHFHQLAQRRVERLLADAEHVQQLLHAQPRVAGDEEQDAVVHAAQPALGQHFVGPGGEGLVGEEEGFGGKLLSGRVFKVKHIDVSVRRGVVSVNQFDSFYSASATGDPWPSPNASPA
ncbi:hypothetical protein D9M70_548780 [compost metagenome]